MPGFESPLGEPSTGSPASKPTIPAEAVSALRQIVFGTTIARHIEDEPPATIVRVVRERIWDNLDAYLLYGDWPDRPQTREEVEAEIREMDLEELHTALTAHKLGAGVAEPDTAIKQRKRRTVRG